MKLPPANLLPPPNELGAPDKFVSWRPEQVDAIMRLTDSDKRFLCFNMPTGAGKSLVSSMGGKLLGGRTLVLTSTKSLQDHIIKDGLVDTLIQGQNNYECVAVRPYGPLSEYASKHRPITMVDRGPCHVGVHCWMKFNGCRYFDYGVRYARESQIVSANYSYWLALGKSVRDGRNDEQLGKFDLIVCDEAHAAADEVCAALRIELPVADLQGLLGIRPLTVDAPVKTWRTWADSALRVWDDEMGRLSTELRRGQYIDPDIVDEFKVLQGLGTSLAQVSDLDGDWVIGNSWKGTHVQFDPVWPTGYTEELLFRGAEKVLFLSATVVPKALDVLGVPEPNREYVEYPSSFPVAARPLYILQSAPRVDFRMSEIDERLWIDLIDAFIEVRMEAGRKGIIHCVSYARMDRIRRLSRFSDYFIVNTDAREKEAAIKKFKRSSDGILVSPSVQVGEDFPDDQCRWIVIPKLPFTDSRDPVARRREQADPGYGGFVMMNGLTQAVGRGNRNPTDWCESIIVDGHAKWALPKFSKFALKYFRDSWQWVHTLPQLLTV